MLDDPNLILHRETGIKFPNCAKDWWTVEIDLKYSERKIVLRKFKQHGGNTLYLQYRKSETEFKRLVKTATLNLFS